MRIRTIEPGDAEAFLGLCRLLDRESTLMMYEPDERATSVEGQRAIIESALASGNSTIIVADAGGRLAGYVAAYGGEYLRVRHSATIVAGVASAFAGQGLGRLLFEALRAWAESAGVTRLELTVQTRNERAIRLYERAGFVIEGTRRNSMIVDGAYQDELAMALLLDRAPCG